MGTRDSINVLVKYVRDVQFPDVRQDYETAIKSRQVPEFLPIRIKNLCENLRSALDYVAREIWLRYGGGNRRNAYFPIRLSEAEFEEYVAKNFPKLKSCNSELWSLLKRVQPLPGSAERWLGDFNDLNNNNKHQTLVLHISRTAPVGHADALNLGMVVHLDEEVGEWVEFRFAEPDVNALGLIHSAVAGVPFIVDEVLDRLR